MKRIGLIGGMSWESSAEYYRLVNELSRARLGGLHSRPPGAFASRRRTNGPAPPRLPGRR